MKKNTLIILGLFSALSVGAQVVDNSITIENCEIYENNSGSYYGGGIYVLGSISDDYLIRSNKIYKNEGNSGAGIMLEAGANTSTKIQNCFISENKSTGSGGAIYIENSVTIENSTLVNNSANALGGGICVDNGLTKKATISNTVLWGNNSEKFDNVPLTNCAIDGVTASIDSKNNVTLAAENIGTDANAFYPAFIDPVSGDWGLLTGSALIKSGTVTTIATDLDGFDRSGNMDIGAYIYNGVGAPVNGVASATGKLTRGAFAQMGDASTTKIDLTGATLPANPVACSTVNPNALIYAAADAMLSAEKNLVQNNTCEKLVLTDGSPFTVTGSLTATAATYTRNCYRDGGWETIVVPFNVMDIIAAGASVKADYSVEGFTEKKDNYAIFESVTAMNAGIPYIMKYNQTANQATQECVFVGSGEVKAIEAAKDFKGTYTEFPKGTVAGKYILNSTGTIFGVPGAEATIPAFRAYLDGQSGSVQVKHMSGATGIGNAEAGTSSIYSNGDAIIVNAEDTLPVNVYTVDGRKVYSALVNGNAVIDGLDKGIYIVNQQKVVIK